jgi:hypothetical protein
MPAVPRQPRPLRARDRPPPRGCPACKGRTTSCALRRGGIPSLASSEKTTKDGASMGPSGRNQWQPVANGAAPKTAQTREIVAVDCQRLPPRLHGKEGVDGSSPSEGSVKVPQIGTFNENLHVLQHAVGVEPSMEPSGSKRAFENAEMTAFSRSRRPRRPCSSRTDGAGPRDALTFRARTCGTSPSASPRVARIARASSTDAVR